MDMLITKCKQQVVQFLSTVATSAQSQSCLSRQRWGIFAHIVKHFPFLWTPQTLVSHFLWLIRKDIQSENATDFQFLRVFSKFWAISQCWPKTNHTEADRNEESLPRAARFVFLWTPHVVVSHFLRLISEEATLSSSAAPLPTFPPPPRSIAFFDCRRASGSTCDVGQGASNFTIRLSRSEGSES